MSELKRSYGDADIMKAAQVYFVTGSTVETAKITKIPRSTIRNWKVQQHEQWVQALATVSQKKREELDREFTAVIEKSTAEMRDRLEHGDEFYDTKTGEKYRKKVSGRDLAIIAGTLFDKQRLLRGLPTSSTSKISLEDDLKRIAAELSKHAGPRPKSVNVIEGVVQRMNEQSES